jgi:hypothetical protein
MIKKDKIEKKNPDEMAGRGEGANTGRFDEDRML